MAHTQFQINLDPLNGVSENPQNLFFLNKAKELS